MLKTERFEATSVDAAVAKGLQQLRLSREDVEVQVIQEAKKGFLGLGAKDAIVAIHYTEREVPEIDATSDALLKSTDVNQNNATIVETSANQDEQISDPRVAENEQVADDTMEVEDVSAVIDVEPEEEVIDNETAVVEEPTQEVIATETAEPEIEEFVIDDESEVETISSEPAEEPVQEAEALELVDEDFKDVEFVAEYLIDVLASYLVDANIEVEDRGRTVIYNIQTEKKGLVIGKHGKIINSLETLAQVMTHQHVRPHVKVIVNVGNYRERRQETLARLARKTADQVAKSKQPVFLDPLPAAERKIIHAQLARYSYIATHSEGKEPHRYLVVSYKD